MPLYLQLAEPLIEGAAQGQPTSVRLQRVKTETRLKNALRAKKKNMFLPPFSKRWKRRVPECAKSKRWKRRVPDQTVQKVKDGKEWYKIVH